MLPPSAHGQQSALKDILSSCKPLLLIKSILSLICSGCSEELLKLNCFPLHYEEE